jgi:hypothetical protein
MNMQHANVASKLCSRLEQLSAYPDFTDQRWSTSILCVS